MDCMVVKNKKTPRGQRGENDHEEKYLGKDSFLNYPECKSQVVGFINLY